MGPIPIGHLTLAAPLALPLPLTLTLGVNEPLRFHLYYIEREIESKNSL